ncbi:MAG TPA: dihydrodipicolinate synthase family protein [Lacunisphaera sp.]|nr:dihydrodipicolinate synthase family protein [Lacunisphaera sp.]
MTKILTIRHHTRAQLRGSAIVPLMTPFTPDGAVDEPAVRRLVDHVIAGGCQGILLCGTTGEFASLSLAARLRLARLVGEAARGRALLFGGIGDTSVEHSVQLAREYFAAGFDAVVNNLPSYYPLTPAMMESYFRTVADRVEGPLYLYNIPQTVRQSIPLDVLDRISRHPRIAGLKDSEPDAARQEQLSRHFAGREDFCVFAGSVAYTSKAMRAGADGFVPSGGNLAPRLARDLMDQLLTGDTAAGDAAQHRINALNAVYQTGRTITQTLAALKGALELAGLCGRSMLPPITAVTDAEVEAMRAPLREMGIIP